MVYFINTGTKPLIDRGFIFVEMCMSAGGIHTIPFTPIMCYNIFRKVVIVMKTVTYYNEKGNVKATVRNALKKQVLNRMEIDLEDSVMEVIPNAQGGFSIPLAQDVNGEIVYAQVEVKVNTTSPDTAKKGKTKKSTNSEPKDIFEYKEQMKEIRAKQ